MKKLLGSTLILVLGLIATAPRSADALELFAESSAGVRAESRLNFDAKKSNEERSGLLRANAHAEARAEVRAEARKEWSEENRTDTNARVKAHAHWMTKRFAVVIERLETLADRIESRIEKLEDEDKDTTVAADFVAKARVELDEASEGFVDLSAKLEAAIETRSWTRETFQELRALAGQIKTDIKEARQDLLNAVRSLKGETEVRGGGSIKSNMEVQ